VNICCNRSYVSFIRPIRDQISIAAFLAKHLAVFIIVSLVMVVQMSVVTITLCKTTVKVHQRPPKKQGEANSEGALAAAAAMRRQIDDASQGKSN
jgi:hypothetical protein